MLPHKLFPYGFGLVLCVVFASVARADNVDLVGGNNLTWNIVTSPTASPTMTIQIQNQTASPVNQIFNGYDLGLIITRTSGSGSIVLSTAIPPANPSSNSIVPSWVGAPYVSGNYMNNEATSFNTNYVVPSTATNLVALTFAPGTTPTAGSTFQVLSDYNLSDYFNYNGGTTPYANNVSSDFLLGTITIAPVPEPSTVVSLLSGLATLGIGWGYSWRRKRRVVLKDSLVAHNSAPA
jgi:hypothetical protein